MARLEISVQAPTFGKGHKEIIDRKWIEDLKGTKTYWKKNSYAISLLYEVVERDLQSKIKLSRNDFTLAYQSLACACGEKSIIVAGDMLFRLIHLAYEPGTSLRDHVARFKNLYVDLVKTIEGQPPELRFLEVSQGMAAVLFLKSLCHDTSLSSLVQSSYDLMPFTLMVVSNRIMLEDS